MSKGEEWAEEAGSFFAEFADNTREQKSKRKLNRETHDDDYRLRMLNENRNPDEVARSVAEAKRKIAAAVFSNASKKEKQSAARKAAANEPKRPKFGAKVMAKEREREQRKLGQSDEEASGKPKGGKSNGPPRRRHR